MIPVTLAPYSRAAWIAKLPQPQPTSSTRCPALQLELLRDHVQLGPLRLRERLRAAREQRAAVGHRLVEEQREEVVADVVVVADRLRVALRAVARAGQQQLGRGPARDPARERRERERAEQPRRSRGAIGGGTQSSTTRKAPSMSSVSSDPSTYARPSPSGPGARSACAIADGRRT